jgi:beta-lactamase class A
VSISAAVTDLNSGRTWVLNPTLTAYTASIIKVPILLAYAHRYPPSSWSAATLSLARQMIQLSSNDAATTLWTSAGGAAALSAEFSLLGMRHTTAAPTLFEPWDGVRTTVGDQVRLLRLLMRRKVTGSTLVLRLMESPGADQQWGVGEGLPSTWQVARKDGWVPTAGQSAWAVNSIGVATGRTTAVAVAIITTGAPTYAQGQSVVNAVARIIDANVASQDK